MRHAGATVAFSGLPPLGVVPVELGRGARGAVTSRQGGDSSAPFRSLNLSLSVGDEPGAVYRNRLGAAIELGFEPGSVVWMEQTHGCGVAVIEEIPTGPVPADALVTRRRDVVLAVLVADCVPVLLADAVAGVVAVAHAGRRGLAAGILPATLAAMVKLGAVPAAVTAATGPAIGPCCYEVPAQLQAEVAAAVPGTAAPTRHGTPALDLPAGVVGVLRRAGVRRCTRSRVCTADDPAYFSHRRDGVTGRFAGYAWRT